jgi:hypothetical protein
MDTNKGLVCIYVQIHDASKMLRKVNDLSRYATHCTQTKENSF